MAAAGRYNVLFEPAVAAGPYGQGTGYARVTVAKSGAVRAIGTLADGARWSYGGKLSRDGQSAFFLPLYAGRGLLRGEFLFTPGTVWDCAGTARWARITQGPAPSSSAPFSEELNLVGSPFSPTRTGALGLTEGRALIRGYGLEVSIDFTVSAADRVSVAETPENLKLTFDSATGLFGGSFIHPLPEHTVRVSGIVIPDEHRAAGFFSAPAASGSIELVPR